MLFLSLFIAINAATVLCSESKPPFRSDAKCCPQNSTYISAGHYCQKKKLIYRSYTPENVSIIFFHTCKIILDEDFNSTADSLIDNFYCINENEKGFNTVRRCYSNLDICKDKQCIKKCCPQGQSFVNSTTCHKTAQDYGLDLSQWTAVVGNSKEPYAIIYNSIYGNVAKLDHTMHDFLVDDKGRFNVTINGYLSNTWSDNVDKAESYCIEHFKNEETDGFFFYMSEERLEFPYEKILYPLILSCIFSVLTIVIYVSLGETKKIFGKILACYCLAVLMWFGGIATYIITDWFVANDACKILAYFNVFARSSNFTWLSVLCWDLWKTLGSTKGRMDKYNLHKKFFVYSLYAWGVPALMMSNLLFFCIYNTILPDVMQPVLTKGKCLFATRPNYYGEILFNMVPNITIQICCIVLFVMTIVHCITIKYEIEKMNDTMKEDKFKDFRKDKERLILLLKLMVIMGVIFIYEASSAFFPESVLNSKYIIYPENFFNWINALQGVWIFVIFVCKKHMLGTFCRRFKDLVDINHSLASNTTYSSTISNLSQKKDIPLKECNLYIKQQTLN